MWASGERGEVAAFVLRWSNDEWKTIHVSDDRVTDVIGAYGVDDVWLAEHRGGRLHHWDGKELSPVCFIVLESIANVAKHARATDVKVKVWVEDQRVVTEIEDDGIGGATDLRKLKDRARAAGGTIEIDSPPGVGTLIRAEVPFAPRRSR